MFMEPEINAVYLTGPNLFNDDAETVGRELKALCARHGLEGLWPGDSAASSAAPRAIVAANRKMMQRAAAIVADISPFPGPQIDPGTGFDIGAAVQAGIPVFAFTSGSLERGSNVENFDLRKNLTIACCVASVSISAEDAIRRAAKHLAHVAERPASERRTPRPDPAEDYWNKLAELNRGVPSGASRAAWWP